ncbi:MAG: hypothetical protein RMJ15_03470 [Nitrososphaerota archaeon]|nr:hypothetical protein [Nitrososphaerota archaeon]
MISNEVDSVSPSEEVVVDRHQHSGDIEWSSSLECLKMCLDDVCERLAVKFDLFDRLRRPEKTFIVDSLFRFGCMGCLWKALKQKHARIGDVDVLYREMHGFAVNVLSGILMQVLGDGCFNVNCEEAGKYGRVDVTVKPTQFGVAVEAGEAYIVVEVKTGKGLSFSQLFRYLLHRPKTILIVWRVRMRQVFTLRGKDLQALLCVYISAAIGRALKLLNSDIGECNHNLGFNGSSAINDPQKLLDDFFQGLAESLPKAVSAVVEALKEAGLCKTM